MPKRLTAEEVAIEIESWEQPGVATWGARRDASKLVRENLVPCWQDEPDGDGWYWVRGLPCVCNVYHWTTDDGTEQERGGWSVEYVNICEDGSSELRWEPLNGRQVCPITPRPKN